MADERVKNQENVIDGTSLQFLGLGWWVLHLVVITGIFYLGHALWPD